jgi:hypothetical protein
MAKSPSNTYPLGVMIDPSAETGYGAGVAVELGLGEFADDEVSDDEHAPRPTRATAAGKATRIFRQDCSPLINLMAAVCYTLAVILEAA